MELFQQRNHPRVIASLQADGIGVVLTDTLYGIVASANSPRAVERLYNARGRDHSKPCIVLIDSIAQAWEPYDQYSAVLDTLWPGKVSVVLPAGKNSPLYVHRGVGSIAFRVPDDAELRALLQKTGPLLAPSANADGMPPAMDIAEAQAYFGSSVDFYVDSGRCTNTQASALVRLNNDGSLTTLRGQLDDQRHHHRAQAKKV